MKISVIIPCFNAEKYLHECLSSLQNQSFGDFEAIIINDGSQDKTAEIVRSFAAEDRRFCLVSKENEGVSAARNCGLAAAKGEWIFFLDADDILPSNALETLIHCEADDVDMIVGDHCIFDEHHEERIRPAGRWMHLKGRKQKDAVIKRLIEGDSILNIMCNKLHRRSVLEQHAIHLNSEVKIAEDALFNLNMTIVSNRIAYSPEITYRYRMHEESAMHRTGRQSNYELHQPWLLALRNLLIVQNQIEKYYTCFLNSVTLRVYKDGGVFSVFSEWFSEIRPLVVSEEIPYKKLSLMNKFFYKLSAVNIYRYLYPFFFVFQAIGWKTEELFSFFH